MLGKRVMNKIQEETTVSYQNRSKIGIIDQIFRKRHLTKKKFTHHMRGWSRFLAYCVMFIVWQMGNCSRSSKKISFSARAHQQRQKNNSPTKVHKPFKIPELLLPFWLSPWPLLANRKELTRGIFRLDVMANFWHFCHLDGLLAKPLLLSFTTAQCTWPVSKTRFAKPVWKRTSLKVTLWIGCFQCQVAPQKNPKGNLFQLRDKKNKTGSRLHKLVLFSTPTLNAEVIFF